MSGADAGPLVVAIDQGTSSTKVACVDRAGHLVREVGVAVGQHHPRPGWVEQDAVEILDSVRTAVLEASEGLEDRVVALGLSSQRESAVVWDRGTGTPVGPMLGWQDRRTVELVDRLAPHAARVREVTGLPLDPMFSAVKIAWLLDQVDPDRRRSRRGELAVGTVDSWLLFALTGEHRIETGNASRTQLLDLGTGDWSPELLELFDIPAAVLPQVTASDEVSRPAQGLHGWRFHGVLGDSHAALYGHGVREPGAVKVTYGTGSSVMGLSGADDVPAGLVGTIAWQLGGAAPQRAVEGNILATGATMAWLSRLLGREVGELAALARTAPADHGIVLVPAVAGLGAPYWDGSARAVLHGFDLGTDAAALARAGMESIVHQVEDVLAAADAAGVVRSVYADGAPARDDALMQLQADVSEREVLRPETAALSVLGAAELAAVSAGLAPTRDRSTTRFTPQGDPEHTRSARAAWHHAVGLARTTSRDARHQGEQ
ncbi:FGGY-family carbohydrate kinase [Pseudactinotalea suaedae]|uniref:FGGY-family carbohydrate kinase n=1 Tax=Pseudactinotalea suaedae TaxID=1524924 RepID=UPI0012E2F3D3|nr:FGGY family carbohydrate kinase [Pseudactinotalea suaedae]